MPWITHGSVFDDFRPLADGTLLDGRTTDSGHTWVNLGNATDWHVVDDGAPAGNVAQGDYISEFNRLGIEFGTADVDIEVTLHVNPGDVLGAGLSLRNASNTYYEVNAGAGGEVNVIKVNNAFVGDSTLLQEWDELNVHEKSVLRCVTNDDDFDIYLDGVHLGTVTDSSFTGTNHGIQQRFAGDPSSVQFYAFNMQPPKARWQNVASLG